MPSPATGDTEDRKIWSPVAPGFRYRNRHALDWRSLEDRIVRLTEQYRHSPWRCFGNEAKCALLLRAGLRVPGSLDFSVPAGFEAPQFDRFLVRPCIEPIVYTNWQRFSAWQIDQRWIKRAAALLTGTSSKMRSASVDKPAICGLAPMRYARLDDIPSWPEAIEVIHSCEDLTPVQEAVLTHATFVLYHPLDDGNGRVARSLFHASLHRRDQVDAPFLPLGPSFYSASYLKLGLLRRLSQTGDWEAYLDGVHPIVEFAISLQEHVDDADALSGSISALSQTMTSLD